MKRFLLPLLLVVSFSSFFSLPCLAGALDPVATVVAVRGLVEARGIDGKTRVMKIKDPVFLEDTLKSDKTGRLQMLFKDNTIISLGTATEMKVTEFNWQPDKNSGALKTRVEEGTFRVMGGAITRVAPDNFKTETPAGTIGIRGSMYAGSILNGILAVVFEGGKGIEVTNLLGTVVITKPGFGTHASQNEKPHQPSKFSQKDMEQINKSLSNGKGEGSGDSGKEGDGKKKGETHRQSFQDKLTGNVPGHQPEDNTRQVPNTVLDQVIKTVQTASVDNSQNNLKQTMELADTDGDGVPDINDAFPNDPTAWADSDHDGVPDNRDAYPNDPTKWELDTDGDGHPDSRDAFPNDPTAWADSDHDGVPDNRDAYPNDATRWELDTDGDGHPDSSDAYPNDPTKWELDTDGDGHPDSSDAYPNDPTKWELDTDGDGHPDSSDAYPNDPTKWELDTDGDGHPDSSDAYPNDPTKWKLDTDGDGHPDSEDAYPNDPTKWELDTDGDGHPDSEDAYPNDPTRWEETSNFIAPNSVQLSSYTTWGYWNNDPTNFEIYGQQTPTSVIDNTTSPYGLMQNHISATFVGKAVGVQSTAMGTPSESLATATQLTSRNGANPWGTVSLSINFESGATDPITGSINFDQLTATMHNGAVGSRSFNGQLSSGAGAGSGDFSGDYYGTNVVNNITVPGAVAGHFGFTIPQGGIGHDLVFKGIFGANCTSATMQID